MPSVVLMSISGEKVGELELSAQVFGAERNIPLMHHAVTEELANQRMGQADTKTRGEVRGGGKKPYRQKGTGRARQGTVSAPHYMGGGVVFGPHPRSYEQRMPRKMRKAALRAALSAKLADGELVIVDDFKLDDISTKKMVEILDNIGAQGKVLVGITQITDELAKSSRNIPGLILRRTPGLSVVEVVDCDRIVLTKAAAQALEEAFSK